MYNDGPYNTQADAPQPAPAAGPPRAVPDGAGGSPPAAVSYEAALYAADEHAQAHSGASAARTVALVVCGDRGDTGRRLIRLHDGDSGGSGGPAAAVHAFEAPDVGELRSVWVGHDGGGAPSSGGPSER